MVLGHDMLTSERTQDIKIAEDVSFDSMLLTPNTLTGLKTSGFYVPSPIQLHGIPLGKCGFDLLLEAKSGTGKTAVFSVIALEKLNLDKGVQTLVLAPTREIASQICDVIKAIGANFEGLSVEVVMGGLSFAEDVEKFKKKVHIVVGSPGRLHHLIKDKHIDVSSVRLMVLDEADKLVEKSFLPDINYIFSLLPSQKQIIMSSATYPENIKTIMSNYVHNAHHICPDSSSVLLGIEQNVIIVPSHVNIVKQTKNRYEELNRILSKKKFKQCLVFCNYQVRVGEVHKMLNKDKWPADKLYGQQQQTDRLEALKILQEYQCRILVTTDLAARGIDASNVDLVINFEIPYNWQTYLHRIGRAGRFGSYGSAITILCEGDEEKRFKTMLSSINIPFDLKYLWSKEPFLLDSLNKGEEIGPRKEIESQPEIKESEKKLGTKEVSEQLWKVLSVELIEPKKEMCDIPTFESLCVSFEQANKDSSMDNIESFSDLLSSFQNHEIKSNEKSNYNPVEVNQLLIPCNIFNSNVILQTFQKHKSDLSLSHNNKKENLIQVGKVDGPNLVHNEIESKNFYSLSKPKHEISKNLDSKQGNSENDDTYNDSPSTKPKHELIKNAVRKSGNTDCGNASSENDEQESSKLNGNAKGNQLKNNDNIYLPTASGSSEYNSHTKSKTDSKPRRNEYSNNQSKRFGKVQMWKPVSPKTNVNDDHHYLDESDSISQKSDYNANASILHDDENALLSANLPTAFGKSKQWNNYKSEKNCGYYKNKRNSEYQVAQSKTRPETKTYAKQRAEPVYESSGGERTEDESVIYSYRSLGAKSSKSCRPHSKSSKPFRNNGTHSNGYTYNMSNNVIEERQHQFDLWYKQLQTQMLLIERSVYIAEMSSPY